jgi:hypothetical protein
MGILERKRFFNTSIWLVLIMLTCQSVFGQVEHNYLIGPQSTDCDSLYVLSSPIDEAIENIERSTFRFQQQFKISRTYGVMNARYYSCDGEKGFLIINVDRKDFVYMDVPKSIWDNLITSPDINTFYVSEIEESYDVITDR